MMAALMGLLTGIGGGMLHDVLVNQTPTVLKADLYAVAALAAALLWWWDRSCTTRLLQL
ncbi:MAG: hypothetical protein JWN34_292 [Bryobacterales bacterium]|nr:hypothetical protein [Bryobacterales bacterium]